MPNEILKALLTGFCAAAPIGPVAILAFQKSVGKGHRCGWITGLGGTVVDTTFALVGLFALTLIQDFVERNSHLILVVGGLVVAAIGLMMFMNKKEADFSPENRKGGTPWSSMLQAMSCGFANPGALAFMLVLLGVFGLSAASLTRPVWLILICVFAGGTCYWFLFSLAADKLGGMMSARKRLLICRIAGICVVVFGLALTLKGIIN